MWRWLICVLVVLYLVLSMAACQMTMPTARSIGLRPSIGFLALRSSSSAHCSGTKSRNLASSNHAHARGREPRRSKLIDPLGMGQECSVQTSEGPLATDRVSAMSNGSE
jgi:hypothetical protein